MKWILGLVFTAIIGVQSAHAELDRDPVTGIPVVGMEFCAEQKAFARDVMVMRQAGWSYEQASRHIPDSRSARSVLDLMYRSEVGSSKQKQIDMVLGAEDTIYKACIKAAKEADMKLNGV